MHHHERWDGHGYPHRLEGEAIPIGARILAVAEFYQLLTCAKGWRKPRSGASALKLVAEASGTRFDPAVVEALSKVVLARTPVRS
ncbi:MAG: HD-GYP domain-containing protein [Terriglobia bacterium]